MQISRKLEDRKKKMTEVVINCFENSISIPVIANIAQLSEDDVIRILKEHGKI